MTPKGTQARIKSRIWQAVAQADLDVSAVDKDTLEALVELITDAAMLELDAEIDESLTAEKALAVAKTAVSADLLNTHFQICKYIAFCVDGVSRLNVNRN